MVRAFLVHAALIGQTAAVRRFHLPHHVLSFVSRPPSVSGTHAVRQFRGFGNESKNDRDGGTRLRQFGSKLMESATDNSLQDHSVEEVYIDGNGFMYDSDADEDGEEMEEPLVPESEQSRSHLLHKALFESVQSAMKNLNKKTSSLRRELEKAQSLEDTMWRANLIVSNLYQLPPGTTSIEVQDWENDGKVVELVLNTKEYSSAQEESDALFALARKMKRGSNVVAALLKDSLDAEECLKDGLYLLAGSTNVQVEDITFDEISEAHIDEGELVLIREKLERTSKKTGFKSPNLEALLNTNASSNKETKRSGIQNQKSQRETRYKPNPRELISPSGHKVLVGRNRRDNEAICFQLSRPTDIWMHSRGCPGAHVLLCVRRGGPPVADEDLQFAADLAVFYSDARTERKAPVTTTEPKHITKPRGAPPGAVTLRQEGKTLMGRAEMVSDDLKVAREMSGGAWDEQGYKRDGTRSRNKKRTAAVEKATRDKKRQEANAKSKRKARKEENDWY